MCICTKKALSFTVCQAWRNSLILNNIKTCLKHGIRPNRNDRTILVPLKRLFSTEGMHKILDCLLSNYELEQKPDDIAKFTKLGNSTVNQCLSVLVKEKLVIKQNTTYKTKITSERLAGLFSYYRATMGENLRNLEFNTVDLK